MPIAYLAIGCNYNNLNMLIKVEGKIKENVYGGKIGGKPIKNLQSQRFWGIKIHMSPTIFREKGYRFYFLSNEEKRIHIHVTSEDGEAKFWLEPMVSLAVYYRFSPKKLNEIQGIIEEHKDEIIKAWQKHFRQR